MKLSQILKVAVLAMPLILAVSCSTHRKASKQETVSADALDLTAPSQMISFMEKVNDNAQTTRFITSKVKFSLDMGGREMTLTGNLRMKRDDVIRLQLMAFGFVEAGRLEFTKEYVLVMDRINKLYLKMPYAQLEFLRNNNIDFFVLQGLFWNELFQPKKTRPTNDQLENYKAEMGEEVSVISMGSGKLSYRWLAENRTARIKMANVLFSDKYRGNYQLNWDYEDFQAHNRKSFPMEHKITLSTPDRDIKMGMTLNNLGAADNWELRTEVSSKYRQVTIDEILQRFLQL